MKNSEGKVKKMVSQLICYCCGLQATPEDNTVHEYSSGEPERASAYISGEGRITSVNLCEKCFADMCDESSSDRESSNEEQGGSELQIAVRNTLSANKITSQKELSDALKRVEQLWGAKYYSAEGNELHRLADLICVYEGKNWNSYINEEGSVSDDFLAERECIVEEKGAASVNLSGIIAFKGGDDEESVESSIEKGNEDLSSQTAPESQVELLETIAKVWAKYPELRLTQLVVNAINPNSSSSEVFYVEDSELLNKLKQL